MKCQYYGECQNMAWQPIETAPKDGGFIVLFDRMPIIGRWGRHYRNGSSDPNRNPEWMCRGHDFSGPPVDPSHWMPLPEPPK